MNPFIRRISLIISLISIPVAIYFLNPFQVKVEDIRPRLTGYDIYRLPSRSMEPTLVPGDYILVSHLAFQRQDPLRGDIVIFKLIHPKNPDHPTLYVKRVVALANEKVKIHQGRLYINDKVLPEDYVKVKNNQSPYSLEWPEKTVPPGSLFLLGDNRDHSNDSRLIGFIPQSRVIGKAVKILYGNHGRSGNQL